MAALALAVGLESSAQAGPIDDAQLVADVNSGAGGSSPEQLTRVGDRIFFVADGPDGTELFVSDGTTAGTKQVVDINPGAADSDPDSLTAFGGKLYFSADNGSDTELWISDGTAVGTFERDLNPAGSSFPSELTDVGGTLFFMAAGDGTGRELWTSDGTAGGTAMVVDRNVGPGNSGGSEFADINGTLYFRGSANNNTDFEPWISDGTPGGTVEVADLLSGGSGAGSLPAEFVEMGGVAYFTADGHNIMGTTESDRELYRSDGTAAGTYRVKDIATGGTPAGSDSAGPGELTVIGDTLFFSAGNRAALTGGNRELWKSDGTEAGTEVVKEIVAGNASSNPVELTKVGTRLFFGTSGGANGQLWVSDGTEPGTEKIADLLLLGGFAFNGELVAGMFDGTDAELWRSDGTAAGTAAGTVLVKDINDDNGDITNRFPMGFESLDGSVLFRAGDSSNGVELFKALDTAEPETSIDSGPSGGVAGTDRSPEHGFSADDSPATFECRTTRSGQTPAAFATCSGPGDTHSSPFSLIDGDYTFEVRAVDVAGNADSTPASAEFTVDNVGPETMIDAAPPSRTSDRQPQTTFSSADADLASFQCSLDGAAFAACASPFTPPAPVAEGPHRFDVRAVDGAGNRGQVERVSFSVDATGPATKIDSAPDATTPDATAVLRFSSPDADAVAFQCSVDGGEFTGCGSPHTVAGLGVGPHTVDVRARDDLGNVGAAQRVSFTVVASVSAPVIPPAAPGPVGVVDTVAPQTVITKGPVVTRWTRPRFEFGSPEAGATFGCRVGSGAFRPCSSPWRPTKLKEGSYRFEVRATDAAGNTDSSPARRRFRVDRRLVKPRVSVSRRQRVRGSRVRVTAKGGADEAVTVSVSGSVRISGRRGSLKLRSAKRKSTRKKRVSVRASLTLARSRTVRSALKRGRSVTVRLRVSVADAAGNRFTRTRTVRLRR